MRLQISGDKSIFAEYKEVSIGKLKLDVNDPRFRHEKRIYADSQIEDRIWDDPDTKLLYKAIIASRGLGRCHANCTLIDSRPGGSKKVTERATQEVRQYV